MLARADIYDNICDCFPTTRDRTTSWSSCTDAGSIGASFPGELFLLIVKYTPNIALFLRLAFALSTANWCHGEPIQPASQNADRSAALVHAASWAQRICRVAILTNSLTLVSVVPDFTLESVSVVQLLPAPPYITDTKPNLNYTSPFLAANNFLQDNLPSDTFLAISGGVWCLK